MGWGVTKAKCVMGNGKVGKGEGQAKFKRVCGVCMGCVRRGNVEM